MSPKEFTAPPVSLPPQCVGPVLLKGSFTDAIIQVLQENYPQAQFLDHSSYIRVLVPEECCISKEQILRFLPAHLSASSLSFPRDLEKVICAMRGHFSCDGQLARWSVNHHNQNHNLNQNHKE